MPYNGSGTFTPYTPGNPVVTGTVISSTAFNATQNDLAAGLTNAITRDGQSPPSANLPMGGKKHTGLAAGVTSGDSLRWEQLFSQGIEQDIASAATTDIGSLNTTNVRITGTTTITSFGTNYNGPRYVRFAGVLTLAHNATTLILPGGVNITTAAGDCLIAVPNGSAPNGWRVVAYQVAALVPGTANALTAILGLAAGGTGSSTGPILLGHIAGLQMSTAGSSSTMSISAGQATDSTSVALLNLASGISKTTSAWTVGSGNGGIDTGTIANNTWYHFHLIRRPDTGVVDVLFSLSPTAPTLPTNYTQFRRIGSGRTNGSAQWVRFFQTGDQFLWDNLGSLDYDGLSTTSATLTTLSVPTGVKVRALMNMLDSNAAASTKLYLSDPDISDVAPSTSAWPLGTTGAVLNAAVTTAQVTCTTNTSAQIRQRSTRSDSTIRIATIGWFDSRGA